MDDIIIHNDLVQPPTYLPMNVSEMTYFYFILFIVLFVHETDGILLCRMGRKISQSQLQPAKWSTLCCVHCR